MFQASGCEQVGMPDLGQVNLGQVEKGFPSAPVVLLVWQVHLYTVGS